MEQLDLCLAYQSPRYSNILNYSITCIEQNFQQNFEKFQKWEVSCANEIRIIFWINEKSDFLHAEINGYA